MTPPITLLMTVNSCWNLVNFRASLIAALQQQGYRVVCAAPPDEHTPKLKQMVDAYYPLPMQNDGTSPLHDALLWLRYVLLLRRIRPSAVLAYTIKPNIYGTLAARLLGIAVINNVSGLGTAFIKQNWITRVVQFLYRTAFRFSRCVFFQNADDRDLFIEHRLVASSKAKIIAGSGIDVQHFKPLPYNAKAAGSPCAFVLVARMLRDKGVAEFVEAARIVKQLHPDCKFRLVGPLGVQNKTAITPEDMQQWLSEGAIEYWGERSDIAAIMQQHDCVVLPSYREGLSRVLLEAGALGIPSITTNVSGCRDVVRHEVNGLLCEVRSSEDLAAKMLQFIALDAPAKTAMSKASRQVVEQQFDQALVHTAYLDQLQRLAL